MTPARDKTYDAANDDNQGVVQLMAQAEAATPGVAQSEPLNPVTAQGPEPVKEEVNDNADAVNDDLLEEEDVATGEADEEDE